MDLVAGVDSRDGYVSKILYVKTKESGPLGGRARRTPPRSANDWYYSLRLKIKIYIICVITHTQSEEVRTSLHEEYNKTCHWQTLASFSN